MNAPLVQTTLYGSDDHGMVYGFRLHRDGTNTPIHETAELGRAELARPASDGSFVWLHFNLANAAAEPWLRAHADLPEEYFDALHSGSRSTRIERDGDTLFAVINDVTFNFAFEASDVATLWVSVRPGSVVSARLHPLRSVDRLRHDVKRGLLLETAAALLEHLLRHQADELQRIVRTAIDRVDDIEDEVLAGRVTKHGAELARLRRMTVRLQRLLAPEPGALLRLLSRPPAWVGAQDVQRLQQAHDEFVVVLRDVASLQDRIKLLQDETAARVAEDNNRSLFVLTAVTVLALPINLTSGLMGMNVGGVPFAEQPHGFWWMVVLIAALTGLLVWLGFRRWLSRGRRK
jgi:zinc transporter